MRKAIGVAVGAVLAVTHVVSAGAYHARGDRQAANAGEWKALVVPLRQMAGSGVRGAVQLSAHRRGPTRVRGLILGLGPSGLTGVALVLSGKPACSSDSGSAPNLTRLPVKVAPDGSGFVAAADAFTPRAVRQARTVAVIADQDADGRPALLACGSATAVTARDAPQTSGYLATAQRKPSFLAQALSLAGGTARVTGAVTGLDPNATYNLGVSNRSCSQLRSGSGGLSIKRVARFTTDPAGQAVIASRTGRLSPETTTMSVTRPFTDGLVLCARVEVDGVVDS